MRREQQFHIFLIFFMAVLNQRVVTLTFVCRSHFLFSFDKSHYMKCALVLSFNLAIFRAVIVTRIVCEIINLLTFTCDEIGLCFRSISAQRYRSIFQQLLLFSGSVITKPVAFWRQRFELLLNCHWIVINQHQLITCAAINVEQRRAYPCDSARWRSDRTQPSPRPTHIHRQFYRRIAL